MITFSTFNTRWAGNLGNQLFQIASLIGLARRYDTNVTLPPRWRYFSDFPFVKSVEFGRVKPDSYVEEPHFHLALDYFDTFKDKFQNEIVDVKGWLQSEMYWLPYKSEVLRNFMFRPDLTERIERENAYILSLDRVVAISVRRGDYVNNSHYALLPKEYYLGALEQYFPNHRAVIFTDDFDWCKETFGQLDRTVYADQYGPIEQLCFMSLFKKYIVANSTFSWWGAYLSYEQEVVIRPNYHFGQKWDGIKTWAEYYPDEWLVYDHCRHGQEK